MNRRDFLKTAATVAVLGAVTKLTHAVGQTAGGENSVPDMVAVRGGDPVQMFERAIREMGGMESFVKKGQKVVVKPNIGWDRTPEYAANTNPELIGKIVEHCKRAGASEIYVFDTTCNAWDQCYKNSGIEAAAKAAGAIVIGGDSSREPYRNANYFPVDLPGNRNLKTMMLNKLIRDCDVFINVPVLKHHGGPGMTACMKNLMGVVAKESQRYFHKNNLNGCIAECVAYRKPDLNILDAYRVMTKRGPRGVDLSDVKLLKYQLISKDIVAIDTAAAKLLEFDPKRIGYLARGEQLGLGTCNLKNVKIKRITV